MKTLCNKCNIKSQINQEIINEKPSYSSSKIESLKGKKIKATKSKLTSLKKQH